MNERINELEEQCWEPKQYGPPWFNSKKFAESIVRECADSALKKGMASPDTDFRTGSILLSEYLLARFGVEE
jgi:hypothetical protein